jgi:hypothetical protein
VIVVNEKVMFDSDWLMPSRNEPGVFIPRCTMDYAVWEPRDGKRRIQGLSQWELMSSPQEVVNEVASQTQSVRRTCAVPVWLADRASNFELNALDQGLPGYIAEIDVDTGSPQLLKPELINNMTIAPGVQAEQAFAERFLDRVAPQIEAGTTQPGVDAAKAIRELKEAAGEKREPRIKRQRAVLTRGCAHGALLQKHMYTPEDQREFQVKDEDGNERWIALSGMDIGTEIVVEVEPAEIDAEKDRQAVETALNMQVISGAASPQMQRNIFESLGGNVEKFFEAEMLQENQAKREWVKFRDEQRVPVVDPTLDNSQVHIDQHGRDAMSEWFREMEDRAGWDAALDLLVPDWFVTLKGLMLMPPPGSPPGLQARIVWWWMQQLAMTGFQSPDPQALQAVMLWRAHMETHRLEEERRQMMAAQAALMAAPAGPQTPTGTQVHAGAAPRDKSGGPGANADGFQAQVQQQNQVRALSESQGAADMGSGGLA